MKYALIITILLGMAGTVWGYNYGRIEAMSKPPIVVQRKCDETLIERNFYTKHYDTVCETVLARNVPEPLTPLQPAVAINDVKELK